MDKQKFQELLDSNNLKRIPIYYKNDFVGYVTRDIKYQKGHTRYMTHDIYAFDLAFEQVEGVIAMVKELHNPMTTDIIRYDERETWEYDDGRGYVTHHVYPKTVRKEEVSTWGGTMDEIFARFDRANNRLRYCNGSGFKFADPIMEQKYYTWCKIIPESRSMELYYGGGIVD